MYICVKKDINCKVVGYDEKLARISCFWGAQVARASVGKCHYFFFFGDDKPIPAYDVYSQARQEGPVDGGFARFLLCLANFCVSALHNKSRV